LFEPAHKVTAVAEGGSKSGASASSSAATSSPGRAEPGTDLARRVAAARLRSGLTQAQLAEASGVTDETISRIERGRYEPAVSTLFRLAEALDVSLDRLAGDPGRDGAARASDGSSRGRPRLSPIVRRLRARIDVLTPEAQRALLALAEQLPAETRSRSSR
jgi:transcriptional regulator with XRE-family HTH domain